MVILKSLTISSITGRMSTRRKIKENANVNHIDKKGNSALMLASQQGHSSIVKHLIENGADVNHANDGGLNALCMATKSGHNGVTKILIANKANVNYKVRSYSVLFVAVQMGHLDIVKTLLCSGASFPESSSISCAIKCGRIEIIKFFIDYFTEDVIDFSSFLEEKSNPSLDDKTLKLKEELRVHVLNLEKCESMIPILAQIFPMIDSKFVERQVKCAQRYFRCIDRMIKDGFDFVSSAKTDSGNLVDLIGGRVLSDELSEILKYLNISDETLGKGAFATVRLGTTLDFSGAEIQVAVKCIDLFNRKMNTTLLVKELDCFTKLRHENVVRFYGHKIVSEEYFSHGLSKPVMCLVTELCDEDLESYFISNGSANDRNPAYAQNYSLSVVNYIRISIQILKGMSYIHSKNLIHKDIKLSNILVSKNNAKICDFGLADFLDSDIEETTRFKGTPIYSAPEVHTLPRIYSPASDLFSIGLILYEMWCGKYYYKCKPFDECRIAEDKIGLMKKGKRPTFDNMEKVPPETLLKLIKDLWHVEREERPSAIKSLDLLLKAFEEPLQGISNPNEFMEPNVEQSEILFESSFSQMLSTSVFGSSLAPIPFSGNVSV